MQKKPKFLLRKTLLDVVCGSVGSKMFRTCYFAVGKKNIEVLEDGNLACAFYLTSILKIFSLIKELHTTVAGTEKDMLASGWRDIKKPKVGCVVVYDYKITSAGGTPHRHLGFCVGGGKVVDNSSMKKSPQIHALHHRPIQRLLWHQKLNG